MRPWRNPDLRRLALVAVLVGLAVPALVFPRVDLRLGPLRFQREGPGPLGLRLGLDLQGGVQLVYQAREPGVTADRMEGVARIIERRVNAFGVVEPTIQVLGENRILVQLPGVAEVEEAKRLIGRTARLEFKYRDCQDPLCTQFEDRDTGLTGENLVRAEPTTEPTTGEPIVSIQFDAEGARLFGQLTRQILQTDPNDRIAIFLDEELLIAPVPQDVILGGQAIIRGPDFTPERVRVLAIQLQSGALPVSLELIQEQDVDATLGKDALAQSLVAGYVGLALVVLFMVLYYRIPGLLASLALAIYTTLVLAIFKLVPVTLTLAGIAGFILSIGMAVDANILIFERMKEELQKGRSLLAAVDTGFRRAWPSIRDSNVSTLLTTLILYWFGTRLGATLVAGFALTLFIGVLVSMFSALTVTRTFLRLTARTPLGRRLHLYSPVPLPAPGPTTPAPERR